jgi:hypothetical protein
MKFVAYEREQKEFKSVTLKLLLWPLCGVTVTRRKMPTPQHRVQVVLPYAGRKSFITVPRNYRRVYGGDAPGTTTITAWCDKFLQAESVLR